MDLIKALNEAKAEDLSQLDEQIAEREKELAAMKDMRKLIDTRLNGKAKRKAPTRRRTAAADPAHPKLSERIYDLLTENGSLPIEVIEIKLGERRQAIAAAVARSSWFSRNADGDIEIAISK